MKTTIQLLLLLITLSMYSQNKPDSEYLAINGMHNGNIWNTENYQQRAKSDSLRVLQFQKEGLARAEKYKPLEEPKEMKKENWFTKNVVDVNEKDRNKNDKLIKEQKDYQIRINKVNAVFERDMQSIAEFKKQWSDYAKSESKRIVQETKQREIEIEKNRIQREQEQRDADIAKEIATKKAKEEQKIIEDELKAMPTNPDYKKWKVKYENALSQSQANVDKCEAIIKKHTFKDAFGQKRYDTSDFSASEKKIFNQNLESLNNRNYDIIRDLENDKKYYYYWNDTVSDEKSTWSYRLSSFYNNTSKAY